MRFWQSLSFTETDQLVPLAATCEELGFHGVFLSDHLVFPEEIRSAYPYSPDGRPPFDAETEWPEPWAAISAMAAVTTRLRFDTGVAIGPLRHPIELAKSVSTASVISGGRTAFGVGVGWMREEFELLGRGFRDRGRRLDEMLGVLRALWSGRMVEHRGEFYSFERLCMSPAPPAPIPIHVGGASEAALRRAARHDGWIGAGDPPQEIPRIAARLAALRREAGREREPFELIVAVTAPPDRDLHRRLEDAGVTGIAGFPLRFALGPRSSLARKREALARYAEAFLD
jgi:probable F420-dependent oxidoreductase